MSDSESDTRIPDQLFALRRDLENLTRSYIDKLVASQSSASEYATMLNTILDSIGDGLFVVDKDERVILANREAIRLIGVDISQLQRRPFLDNYTFFEVDGQTPIAPDNEPYSIALREKASVQREGLVRGPNFGKEGRWFRVNAAPVMDGDGEISGVVTVFQDITEAKRLQRQRDSMATLLTHDLKNHLASLDMILETYLEPAASMLSSECAQLLVDLRESNKQFLEISNSLIELYRTDLYSVESCRGEIDFSQLLESVVELNRPLALACNVQVSMSDCKHVRMNGIISALRQVFHNLLHNAIKASPSGAVVELETSASPTHIRVSITDHGVGMSKDRIQALFDSSRVSTSLNIGSTSTGFGLYLCRMIIEAHGGTISCESEPDTRTTFTVELPV